MKKFKIHSKYGEFEIVGESLEGCPHYFGTPEEYTVEEIDITAEHALAEVIKNRVAEYPSAEEFLNAFFDGDQSANLEQLKQARLAIKAKYPKPSGDL
jgi:hypothetical protein